MHCCFQHLFRLNKIELHAVKILGNSSSIVGAMYDYVCSSRPRSWPSEPHGRSLFLTVLLRPFHAMLTYYQIFYTLASSWSVPFDLSSLFLFRDVPYKSCLSCSNFYNHLSFAVGSPKGFFVAVYRISGVIKCISVRACVRAIGHATTNKESSTVQSACVSQHRFYDNVSASLQIVPRICSRNWFGMATSSVRTPLPRSFCKAQ